MSWSGNDNEMRASILVELGELQSGHRMFISDSTKLTPVHCSANLEEKDRDN